MTDAPPEKLPCGCIMESINQTFVFTPCEESCPNYQFVLAEAARRQMPTSILDMNT